MKAEAKAQLNGLRVAPRKARLVVDLIRGMDVEAARTQLLFSKKRVARNVLKLLNSAAANAVNNHGIDEKSLVVSSAYVNGGPILYRWMPRAFGRATPIRKRTCHITIVVTGEQDAKAIAKKTEKKEEKKPEAEKTEVKEEKAEKTEKKEEKPKAKKETKPKAKKESKPKAEKKEKEDKKASK